VEARRIYRGRRLDVYYLVDGTRAYARDFVYGELTRSEQSQVVALVQRIADQGDLDNMEQFRQLHGYSNLYEFKRFSVRLMCFFDGRGRIVLTHGFKKKTDRTPRQEIDRALRLRDAYLAEKGQRRDD
jgi:phage-related protein